MGGYISTPSTYKNDVWSTLLITCSSNMYVLNGACTPCTSSSTPSTGSYVSSLCNGVINFVITTCSSPSSGYYVSSICISGSSSSIGSNTVQTKCSSSPVGSYISTACTSGSYSALGSDTVIQTCSLGKYQPSTDQTSCLNCLPGSYCYLKSASWNQRYYFASAAVGSSIYVMGGYDGYNYKNDVWKSDSLGASWTLVTAAASWPIRQAHSLVIVDSTLLILGGVSGKCIIINLLLSSLLVLG